MLKEKFFKLGHALIIILLIIFLLGQIPYFTGPLTSVMSFILLPLLFGTFLYYLIRPLVRYLQKWINNKSISIVIAFLIVVIILSFVFYFGGSIIYHQGKELTGNYSYFYDFLVKIADQLKEYITIENGFLANLNIRERIFSYLDELAQKLSSYNYMGIFSSITNFGLIILLIPFVLFYFLKDDQKIFANLLTLVPEDKKEVFTELAVEIDQLLSTFISSQLVVAFFLGLVMLAGFLIIGLPNAVALAFIAMITSLIPIIGPLFGSLPAVLVAITNSWILFLGVLVIIIIAQYLEGNVIRPLVQGRQLEIHPVMVLFVVLSGVYLFGFIGALTAVPLYVVLRLLFKKKYLAK
ncbi:AI-2E family transporter [Halanaerobium salsuginis]|nr:AI-2E family transporter [Halanaerobium salsuginis]